MSVIYKLGFRGLQDNQDLVAVAFLSVYALFAVYVSYVAATTQLVPLLDYDIS